MSKSEREFACRIVPVFVQPLDIPYKLGTYGDPQFILELMEPEPNSFIGEVSFRDPKEHVSELPQPLAGDHDPTDDAMDAALDDVQRVSECERQLRSGRMSFSYRDGVFTFSQTINCTERSREIADQLLQHHALAFLKTLGPLIGYGP